MRRLGWFTFCVVLTACGNNAEQNTIDKNTDWLSQTGPIPAFTQRSGDVEKGRHALLHAPYVNCGTPERVFRELQQSFGNDQNAAIAVERDASMDGLPYFTNRVIGKTGIPVVSSNCLTCHGTVLFGELVIGLGNEFADFTQNPSVAVERAGALVQGADETAEWERFADRVAAIAPYIQLKTVGVNSANNLTAALIAHRDVDTHTWLDKPQNPLPPTDPPPVSVPPWWRMSKKHAMFNLGEGRGDHARIMLAASMLCADSVSELNEIDQYAPDIRAYLASIEPPQYPFQIEKDLANSGQDVFETHCSACHGTYGDTPDYPNVVIPIETINTDARLMEVATGAFGQAYAQWFNDSWFGELSHAAPAKGYVAPPLDGIWATAPYLHNGSVPSIGLLLQSDQRPTRWRHLAADASDPESYDTGQLGWKFETVGQAEQDPNDTWVYDTTQAGYGNGGHAFGDQLSKAQRRALLEYLKTL